MTNLREKEITIPAFDGAAIYGILTSGHSMSCEVTIFVHGLFGHKNDHLFFSAASNFLDSGIDTFRFDLYGIRNKARNFNHAPISTNVEDLRTILRYCSNKYSNIHLVGHSLGAIVILLFCQKRFSKKIKSITLWEPSKHPKDIFAGLKYDRKIGAYIFKDRIDILIKKKIIEHAPEVPPIRTLLRRIKTPLKVIVAEDAGYEIGKKEYYKNANNPKSFATVKNCGHTFDTTIAQLTLFEETKKWILRCI